MNIQVITKKETNPLPEVQTDRFMLKIKVDNPSAEQEKEIMSRFYQGTVDHISGMTDLSHIDSAGNHEDHSYGGKIVDYIMAISRATRNPIESGPVI